MKKYIISSLFILFTFIHLEMDANKNRNYAYVDYIMNQIPDTCTYSTQLIADYINANFFNQHHKARAVYYWVAKNINYNLENMYTFSIDRTNENLTQSILNTRKGVCKDYTVLFKDIAQKTGLKTYIITGYTKKLGQIDGNPHAWVVCMIDSNWYLMDPTWGSGKISNEKFKKEFNQEYFLIKPEKFIRSHIPFDPMWQLLNFPISKQAFHQKANSKTNKVPFFNFNDSIQKYESISLIEKLEHERNRILENGVVCYLDYDYLIHLKSKISYYYFRKNEEHYFIALSDYNKGLQLLSEYEGYRDKNFQPVKNDLELEQMLFEIREFFNSSFTNLEKIDNTSSIAGRKYELLGSLNKAQANLKEQFSNLEKSNEIAKNQSGSAAQEIILFRK